MAQDISARRRRTYHEACLKGPSPISDRCHLRDSHGIPQVRFLKGNKILRILKGHSLAPNIPEDLGHLVNKVVAVRKLLETNRKTKNSTFHLEIPPHPH